MGWWAIRQIYYSLAQGFWTIFALNNLTIHECLANLSKVQVSICDFVLRAVHHFLSSWRHLHVFLELPNLLRQNLLLIFAASHKINKTKQTNRLTFKESNIPCDLHGLLHVANFNPNKIYCNEVFAWLLDYLVKVSWPKDDWYGSDLFHQKKWPTEEVKYHGI